MNMEKVATEKVAMEEETDGRDYSIWVHMAPLSASIFEFKPEVK